MSATKREVVVLVGVEGGGVTLYGEKGPNGTWRFTRSYADQTPLFLGEPAVAERLSPTMTTWEEALADLDRQGWHRLPAVRIHPEFRERVWAAIQARLPPDRSSSMADRLWRRWEERCGVK